jgi:hypothetical protein
MANRRSVYIAVFKDGSQPNKVYTRFENANRVHFKNDAVDIYRHKIIEESDYSFVPNQFSSLCNKKQVSDEEKKLRSLQMKRHFERYVYIAYDAATNEYKQFTRATNLRIFCNGHPSFKMYVMLRSDWDEHGKLFNETELSK